MAKAVRWQIPFQSLKGVNYRIDIYDNYTGSVPSTWPIQLEPGESPITTEEEADDNFFCPVRPTTGTIQVVDRDGTLSEQIMPANNTERPVKLYSIANNVATIEWQGFLSCEVMEQSYQSTAQVLDLNIIGVLEAMDSIQYQSEYFNGYITIKDVISKALTNLVSKSGVLSNNSSVLNFGYIHYPLVSQSYLNTYIDPTCLVSIDEQATEIGIRYIENGDSFKDILEMVCTYIGWSIRENGSDIYLTQNGLQIGDNDYLKKESYSTFVNNSTHQGSLFEKMVPVNMSGLTYRGIEHNRSFMQGAKTVEVVTNLRRYNIDMEIPECPVYNLVDKTFTVSSNPNNPWRPDIKLNTHHTFSPLLYFQASDLFVENTGDAGEFIRLNGMVNLSDTIENYLREDFRENYYMYISSPGSCICEHAHMMSFYAKTYIDSEWKDILCVLGYYRSTRNDYQETENTYLFKMTSMSYIILTPFIGNIKIKWDDLAIDKFEISKGSGYIGIMDMSLKVGNKYWNNDTQQWGTEFSHWKQSTLSNDGTVIKSVNIPINTTLKGKVEFALYRSVGFYIVNCAMLTSLSVSIEESSSYLSSRDQNRYIQLLELDFKDQETIQCHLSSDLFNRQSPSIICTDYTGTNKMTNINFTTGDENEFIYSARRPEKDLLARMARFYNRVRRKLVIEAEHPIQSVLQRLNFTGYDNKLYKAISENRDWKQDISTLTLLENPKDNE